MAHTFKKPPLPDDELRQQTADWIDSAVADLKRAANCAEGRVCGPEIQTFAAHCAEMAENVRGTPESFSPTPKV